MNELATQSGNLPEGFELPSGYNESASLAVMLSRAEVDQQISTAKAFPRNITRAVSSITTLATLDEESSKECIYALPRGGKPIKGPSIRLAEIIANAWGNNRNGARVVHVDRFEKFVEAEGVFHDLETNTATTCRVRRRITNRAGELLTEDMILVTGNAAQSIAKRNAILGGVPKGVWRKAYEAVERVLAGDIKTLVVRRMEAMKAFAAFGVKPDQIFEQLGVGGLDDIGLEHMGTLIAMHASLKSGESNVEEMFPKKEAAPAGGSKALDSRLDELGKKDKPADGGARVSTGEEFKASESAKKEPLPPHDPATGEIQDEPAKRTRGPNKPKPAAQEETKAPAAVAESDFPGDRPFASETAGEPKPPKQEPATVADTAAGGTVDDGAAGDGPGESDDEVETLLQRAQRHAVGAGEVSWKKFKSALNQKEFDELAPHMKRLADAATKAAERAAEEAAAKE